MQRHLVWLLFGIAACGEPTTSVEYHNARRSSGDVDTTEQDSDNDAVATTLRFRVNSALRDFADGAWAYDNGTSFVATGYGDPEHSGSDWEQVALHVRRR